MGIDELIGQFRDTATVKRVYAEPVERDGVTVIAAARVLGGGGGGEGEGPQGQGKGTGGGFGLMAKPVGAYVIEDGRVRWRPAIDLSQAMLFGLFAVLGLRSIVRAFTKARAGRASG